MNLSRRLHHSASIWLVLTFASIGWLTPAAPSFGQQTQQERIRALQRQLEQMTRSLQQLTGGEAEPAPVRGEVGGGTLNPEWTSALNWRSIGPASMSGRVVRISVVESDPSTFWVATASGGLLKTTNNGTTFEHQFDHENTVSIGDVIHSPSNPDIVWVGTGEQNPRNSVSYGDGVYKSTDGGTTWQHMGLPNTFQIGRMAIHPTNPDIVYVGALGRLYGPNEDRGVYKTTDGGQTWDKVLYVDDKTGVIDLQMHPSDPNTLLAATYERQRGEFDIHDPVKKWGEGAGIYKTTNGGRNWTKITAGLPTVKLGRIGIDYYDRNPNVVYAVVESELIGTDPDDPGKGGTDDAVAPFASRLGGQSANLQDEQGPDGYQYGGIYKSTDGGDSWTRINSLNQRPMYYSQMRVDPSDDRYIYLVAGSLHRSSDGGKTFTSDGGRGAHGDHHAMWIDPNNGKHMVMGSDGGVYVSYDRCDQWDHRNLKAMGQFYDVGVGPRDLYWVYGGLQDNGSWGAPNHNRGTGVVNEDWISIGGGDGFVCRVDYDDPDVVYSESQFGNISRRNLRTGESARIRPVRQEGVTYRFNWKTPFMLSNHNSRIFYTVGNHVFKSLSRGENLRPISPEITRTDQGSGTAVSESPMNPDVLYAGTDDGWLWVSQDGGANWKEVSGNVGLPGPRWVATIEASRYVEGRVYVAFDAHRSDDDHPYLYVSEDFGETWSSITSNLPASGTSRTVREDIVNENLLYAGTETAAFASLDRGQSWTKINNNLPTVAVHEFAQHPTAGEIVVATHGRSLWVLDVTPLRQMTTETLAKAAHLYAPNKVIRWRSGPRRGQSGTNRFVGATPPRAAQIFYSLTGDANEVSLKIIDEAGEAVRDLTLGSALTGAGLHVVEWNLTGNAPTAPDTQAGRGGQAFGRGGQRGRGAQARGGRGGQRGGGGQARGGRGGQRGGGAQARGGRGGQRGRGGQARGGRGGQRGGGRGRGGRGAAGPAVAPGTYRAVLTVNGQEQVQSFKVLADPTSPTNGG